MMHRMPFLDIFLTFSIISKKKPKKPKKKKEIVDEYLDCFWFSAIANNAIIIESNKASLCVF